MSNSIRHMFPGANSSEGFYSLFKYILPQEEAKKLICLKGGPGTGKSSMIKAIAAHFYDKGYNVEHHHCSADSSSLDAVVVKELGIAVLDGTSPHVTDPNIPGAIDEIVNLGSCWRDAELRKNVKEIIELKNSISRNYKMIYRYLAGARLIHEEWSSVNSEAMDKNKLMHLKEELNSLVYKNMPISFIGKDRHLFATSITPQGIVTFIDSLVAGYNNIFVLKGGPGLHKTAIFKELLAEGLKRGLYVEVYHDPFIPGRIEHLLIPELSTALLSSNEISNKSFQGSTINLEDYCNKSYIKKYAKELEYNKDIFFSLMERALKILSSNKEIHGALEQYYISSMDYNALDSIRDGLIDKLTALEKNN